MKHIVAPLVVVALALMSCAKSKEDSGSNGALTARGPDNIFAATADFKESEVLARAALILRAGGGISSEQALHCVQKEEKRPRVREVCALVWAAGHGNPNPQLQEFILNGAVTSRSLAVALSLQPALLKGMPFERVRSIAQPDYPSWVDAALLGAWAETNGSLSDDDAQAAVKHFRARGLTSPAALLRYFSMLYRWNPSVFDSELARYCDPDAKGESRIRCWRLVGVLGKAPVDEKMKHRLRTFLPAERDESWTVFLRTFPDLAQDLTKLQPLQELQ